MQAAATIISERRSFNYWRLIRWLVVVAVIAAWMVTFRPQGLGGPAAFIVVSGDSMEPGLHSGDAVVALEQDSYGVGDAVMFQIRRGEPGAGSRVIHRIVGGNAVDGFKVQGDNKDRPDFWRPTESEIIGKMWFSVPNLGDYSLWLRSPINIAAIAGVLAFLLYVFDGSRKDDDEPDAEAASDPEPQQV